PWNTGFPQYHYFFGLAFKLNVPGKGDVPGVLQAYASEANRLFTIFQTAFNTAAQAAGRSFTTKWVYGGLKGVANTITYATDYAKSHGWRVDAVAVAPYLRSLEFAEPSMDALCNTLSIDQVVDVSEFSLLWKPYNPVTAHKTLIRGSYPNAELICYE